MQDDPNEKGNSQNQKNGKAEKIVDRAARAGVHDGQLVSKQVVQVALAALERALTAGRKFWSKSKEEWREEPDYATQVRAAELILAYGEGRPVERRLEIKANAETWEDQKKRTLRSPEGIRFMLAAGAITDEEAKLAYDALPKGEAAT